MLKILIRIAIHRSSVKSSFRKPSIDSKYRSPSVYSRMMEEPLTTLNLIDKIAGESSPSLASSGSNVDPLEHRRLLRVAASTFTLYQSWWQPPPTITKKRKGKKLVPAEQESAAPKNHSRRRKLVLSDHQNDRELKKRNGLVIKDKDNDCCLGLTLGVSPVSTTRPAQDDQLKEETKENRVAEHAGKDESLLKLAVGTSDAQHCHDGQRPVVHHSDPAMFNIKKKLTSSDLGQNCRLLVPKEMVKNHILPYFNEDKVQRMKSKEGLGVALFDEGRQEDYDLNFKYFTDSMGSYVLNGKWKKGFVEELKLKKNDEVGLYLDTTTTTSPSLKPKFHFSRLKIADPADDVAPAPQQE